MTTLPDGTPRVYRRVSAQPLEFQPLPEAATLAAGDDQPLSAIGWGAPPDALRVVAPATRTVPRAAIWPRNAFKPSVTNDPGHQDWRPFEPANPIQASADMVEASLDTAYSFYLHVKERLDQYALGTAERKVLTGELDIAKKFCLQNNARWDGYLGRLGAKEIELPDDFIVAMRDTAEYLGRRWLDPGPGDDPSSTNSGWPAFTAGPLYKLVGAALAPRDGVASVAQLLETSYRFAARWGIPDVSVQTFGFASRTGAQYKQAEDWQYAGYGSYRAEQTVAGAWARKRHVFMGPYCDFNVLRPLWRRHYGNLKAWKGADRTGNNDALRAARAWQVGELMEIDYSGYDQSVHPGILKAVWAVMTSLYPEDKTRWDCWLFWQTHGVTGPSWYLNDPAHVTVVGASGGMHSGSKLTSWMGGFINMSVVLWVVRRLRRWMTAAELFDGDEIILMIQGDDTVIASALPFDADEWASLVEREIGLKPTITQGCRFLMRHMLPSGPLAVGARVYQQTYWPEYPNIGGGAHGANALGLASRLSRPVAPVIAAALYHCLKHNPVVAYYLSRAGITARHLAEGSSEQLILGAWRREIAQFLEKQTRLGLRSRWLARIVRDAPYSPAAATTLAALERTSPGIADRFHQSDAAFNYAVSGLNNALDSATVQERVDAASTLLELAQARPNYFERDPENFEVEIRNDVQDDEEG